MRPPGDENWTLECETSTARVAQRAMQELRRGGTGVAMWGSMRKHNSLSVTSLLLGLTFAGCFGDNSNSGTPPNFGASSPLALGSTWQVYLPGPDTSYKTSDATVISIS